jgi:radical SAM superfamily enzyme YgiQ (UPF0313 family)
VVSHRRKGYEEETMLDRSTSGIPEKSVSAWPVSRRASADYLFAELPAPGQIYDGAPMSLLYAVAPLHARLVREASSSRIKILKPAHCDHLVDEIKALAPSFLGLSVTTYSSGALPDILPRIRSTLSNTLIVLGGPHFDGLAVDAAKGEEDFGRHVPPSADLVVSGDADYVVDALVSAWESCARDRGRLLSELVRGDQEIDGLPGNFTLWLNHCHRLMPAPRPVGAAAKQQKASLDLRTVPFPPRQLLSESANYSFSIFRSTAGSRLKTAHIKTYRGCLFAVNPENACSFCFVGYRYAPTSIARSLQEIEFLGAQGYHAVFFDDGVFTSSSARRKAELHELVQALKRAGIDQVGFQTRADYLDAETLQILTSANSIDWYCAIGLESTEQGILDSVGKKQSKQNVSDALALLRAFGMRVGLYLLFGAPGPDLDTRRTLETRRTADATIAFVADEVSAGTRLVSVLPGLDMILPGTRDASNYRRTRLHGSRPLVFEPVHVGSPWSHFEGGLGFHPAGVDEELVAAIDDIGRSRIGSLWPTIEMLPTP